MRYLCAALMLAMPAPATAIQFGTAAGATPRTELPRRGAAIHPPKVRQHYDRDADVTTIYVLTYFEVGLIGDQYAVTCGYAYPGKAAPAVVDSVWLSMEQRVPSFKRPSDMHPSLTVVADTLTLTIRRSNQLLRNGILEYHDRYDYLLPIETFGRIFDADSVDMRVRNHTARLRGREVEGCRWLADRLQTGPIVP